MAGWDAQRVAGLAPDARGLTAARALARPGPWSDTGCSDVLATAALRAAVGWAVPTAEVRDEDEVAGTWTVLGVHRSDDGRIAEQRTWLRASDGEVLLLLDFAGGGAALPVPRLVGAAGAAAARRAPADARRARLRRRGRGPRPGARPARRPPSRA